MKYFIMTDEFHEDLVWVLEEVLAVQEELSETSSSPGQTKLNIKIVKDLLTYFKDV